ncbi:MAG: ATPase domain-containing protein [Tepidiformaceae bacterium]
MTNPNGPQRVHIEQLKTGVPGLDEVLGGGLPEYSFNLIAGSPGTGKTTLTHQIMFNLATEEQPALHFTVLGEPAIKMLRYQQQFSFFDLAAVERRVRFVNLTEEVLRHDLSGVLDAIIREVEQTSPGTVVVDSFRTIVRAASNASANGAASIDVPEFLQRLALHLTTWQTTSFLVGEYESNETQDNPMFTIADGLIWLYQSVERNSSVRKMQVVKMRGQAPMPGMHTIRLTGDGVQVFPRIIRHTSESDRSSPHGGERLSTGVKDLDEMLGGGIPGRDSVLVAGPSGSGKSSLAVEFVAAGLAKEEPAVIAVFEEKPKEYMERAKTLGPDLQQMVDRGLLEIIYLRPLDLSVDEALLEIQSAVERMGATRLVIDSLSGFELALAPTFQQDFRESLYRMIGALTGNGLTVLMTAEVPLTFTGLELSPNLVSFLTDDIIMLRYVEIDSQLRKIITVVKARGSEHSQDIRMFEVTSHGLEIGEKPVDYEGLLTGVASRRARMALNALEAAELRSTQASQT